MKLLLIEDDVTMLTTLARTLGRRGMNVASCADGGQALLTWRTWQPDVVTLDLTLPGLDGLQVLAQARTEGLFALSWEAHGLLYGVPRTIDDDLKAGRHVVINVSREVVVTARETYDPARTILVTAPREVLERRLASRGREPPEDIALRLERQKDIPADAIILNDGNLGTALDQFLTALTS